MEIWVGVLSLFGVALGASISWFLARGERKHQVMESRRAEKRAAFERLAIHLHKIENSDPSDDEALSGLGDEFEDVWMPVLILCDRGGPVLKAMGTIPEMTIESGLEKGTAVKLSQAMWEELNC